MKEEIINVNIRKAVYSSHLNRKLAKFALVVLVLKCEFSSYSLLATTVVIFFKLLYFFILSYNMITTYKLVCLFGLACTIIMTLIPSASSIKCFECNSNIDKNCSLKIPPDYLIRDCARNPEGIAYEMCRKITQTIDFEVNGLKPDHRVIRSCAYERHQGDAKSKDCYQRSGFGGRQEVCSCEADLCNNSNNIKINFSILLASASLIFFFSKLVS